MLTTIIIICVSLCPVSALQSLHASAGGRLRNDEKEGGKFSHDIHQFRQVWSCVKHQHFESFRPVNMKDIVFFLSCIIMYVALWLVVHIVSNNVEKWFLNWGTRRPKLLKWMISGMLSQLCIMLSHGVMPIPVLLCGNLYSCGSGGSTEASSTSTCCFIYQSQQRWTHSLILTMTLKGKDNDVSIGTHFCLVLYFHVRW